MVMMQMREATVHCQDFNEQFCQAFDESVLGMLGASVLTSLHEVLQKRYAVSRDELPYRLETAYAILENVFGVKGSRTIEKQIIRRFYANLGLPFNEVDGHTLKDYVEDAERKIEIST